MEKTLKELIAEMDRIEEADPATSNSLVSAGAMVEMELTKLIKEVRRELTDAQVQSIAREAAGLIFNAYGRIGISNRQ
jgi:ribosome-binding ATPase YchF (GTP1/OBG family)